jgi:Uri superfamily endonuclease
MKHMSQENYILFVQFDLDTYTRTEKMKKVLVTGGFGFIGSSFLTFLENKSSIEVHVLNHIVSDTSKKNFVKWHPVYTHP